LGKDAHVEAIDVLAGPEWKLAGARHDGVPHSIFQLVNHIIYRLEWAVKWLDGKRPRPPKHATGSWPDKVGPSNRREWEQSNRCLRDVLAALERHSSEIDLFSKRGKWTPLGMLHPAASHTSYHVWQIAMLRQLLGKWPPPSGGVT